MAIWNTAQLHDNQGEKENDVHSTSPFSKTAAMPSRGHHLYPDDSRSYPSFSSSVISIFILQRLFQFDVKLSLIQRQKIDLEIHIWLFIWSFPIHGPPWLDKTRQNSYPRLMHDLSIMQMQSTSAVLIPPAGRCYHYIWIWMLNFWISISHQLLPKETDMKKTSCKACASWQESGICLPDQRLLAT
jgi:hypothetical protein